MPKIIKNVTEKIICAATKKFETLDYEEVDMKGIAKDANIAVGTLYNYYSNKKDIFNAVFDKSWEQTIENIDNTELSIGNEREFIRRSLEKIYDDIFEKRHMISQYLSVDSHGLERQLRDDLHFEEDKSDNIIKRKLLFQIENQIKNWKESHVVDIEDSMIERFVGILFMNIWGLVISFPNDKNENLMFLNKFIDCMMF